MRQGGLMKIEDSAPILPVRRHRPAAEIRKRLVEATSEAFAANGYAGATTATIARIAGVTEAQLYRYYATKADLFREAVFEPLAEHLSRFTALQEGWAGSGPARPDQARAYISELNMFFEKNAGLLLSLLAMQQDGSGDGGHGAAIEALQRYFETGAATWASRLDQRASVDPQLIVRISFAAVMGTVLFKNWLFPEELATAPEIETALVDFVLNGIT
jgi:AcrR family transcriptional regulator